MSELLTKIDNLERGKGGYTQDTFNAAREQTAALCKALNGGSAEAATLGILSALLREHRYLQNEAIWTLLRALGAFGGLEGRTDARNESAHEACKRLREALAEQVYWPAVDAGGR